MNRLLRISFNTLLNSLLPILMWVLLGEIVNKDIVNIFTITYSFQFIITLLVSIFGTGPNITSEKKNRKDIVDSNIILGTIIVFIVVLLFSLKVDSYIEFMNLDPTVYREYCIYSFIVMLFQAVIRMICEKLYFREENKKANKIAILFNVINFTILIGTALITRNQFITALITIIVIFSIDVILFIRNIGKIDFKIKRVCGINQLIPRDIFFEDCGGDERIADQFGDVFELAKEKEFINKIDSISKLAQNNVNEVISKTNNIEDYLLITGYLNCDNINNYDGYSDFILINDKKLEIMKFPQIKNIYLIEKRYLPKLQYCDFDDDFNKKNIQNSLYYELNDCSKDEKMRNEIIGKSSWLSEKGSIDEQQEYLKQQCRLRLFLAFKFCKIKYSKAIKFNINDDKK